jgi:glycosyltransferase involved in cell wall biosynthesis
MKTKPRILMVGPWPPTRGGITTFMLNVVNGPLKDAWDFVPFTTSRPHKTNVRGDNYGGYRAMLRGGLARVLAGVAITAWHVLIFPVVLLRRRPALVQIHASDFQVFWEAAAYLYLARLFHIPVAFRIGGSFDHFWTASSPRTQSMIRAVVRRPEVLIVQADYWRRYQVETVGRTGPIAVINNFVRENLLAPRPPRDNGPLRVTLYAGENPGLKGAYLLFDAARDLVARGIPIRFRLLAVTDALAAEMRAAGLDTLIEIQPFLPHNRMVECLRDSDVFLQISSSEGFPNTLLEALASGCAAIVTPTGAVPEVVGEEGLCAFTIGRDAGDLADRVARLAMDPALATTMGERGRARIADRFTERTVTAALAAAWRGAIRS